MDIFLKEKVSFVVPLTVTDKNSKVQHSFTITFETFSVSYVLLNFMTKNFGADYIMFLTINNEPSMHDEHQIKCYQHTFTLTEIEIGLKGLPGGFHLKVCSESTFLFTFFRDVS